MAASSSSATPQLKNYDVFLSFRGKDTRYNFTEHLYVALCRKKIETFMDVQLKIGDEISSSLLNTIKASKISVIIFSPNYASSGWCLQELEQILDCKETKQQIVMPIFHKVEPTHVRHQKEGFGKGFAEIQDRFKEKPEMLQRWKNALKEAADLSGRTIDAETSEPKLIDEISDAILKILNKLSPSDYEGLVGVEFSIKEIEPLLHKGSNGVSKLGIWGIGGIGKTTTAEVVFKKILNQFEGSFFAANVREEAQKSCGLIDLQKKLLSAVLNDSDPNIRSDYIKARLKRTKVLIVFDDVTSLQQIENLIGNLNLLSSESQIIITTRDKHVLRNCGVIDAYIYEVKGLSEKEAHQLFNQCAFKQYSPIEDYMELSKKAVAYTKYVPLALKVLGRYLFSREKDFWESAIKNLDKGPPLDIQKVLRVSYDGLEQEEKDLFLDIACFFKGEHIDLVIEILNVCDTSAKQGTQVLIDKCLVSVTYGNEITMHDLLQEMGRKIARDDTCKDIRLWHHVDILKVFKKYKGVEAVRSINLDVSKINNAGLNCHVLSKMDNLRFFRVYNSEYEDNLNFFRLYDYKYEDNYETKLDGFEELEFFPDDITFFGWNNYPFKSLPLSFPLESLVRLDMRHSKVKHWNGVKNLVNLKYVDLSFSKHMTEIPNLSRASNLQELILQGCSSLLEITPSSNRNINKLVELDLGYCKRLISLPDDICKLKFLEELNLKYCSKLERLPDDFGDLEALEFLNTEDTVIKEVPSSILCLPKLDSLYLNRYINEAPLNWVLNSSSGSSSLVALHLENCLITKLPDNLGQLSILEELYLSGNNFESIPENIKGLSNLFFLDISNCPRLKLLPELQVGVNVVASNCSSLQSISDPSFLLLPHWRSRTATFANCFELDLLKILHEESCREFCAMISFPGNEIPKWFTFKNMGSYITLDQSLDWHNKNFLGFFTSVVCPRGSNSLHDCYYVACYCLVKSEDGKEQIYSNYFLPWDDLVDDHIYGDFRMSNQFRKKGIGSDHVLFHFFPIKKEAFGKFDAESLEISYKMKSLNCKVLIKFHAEVKKCGIHFLYVEDYAEPSEISRRSFDNAEKKRKEKEEEKYELQSMMINTTEPHSKILRYATRKISRSRKDMKQNNMYQPI